MTSRGGVQRNAVLGEGAGQHGAPFSGVLRKYATALFRKNNFGVCCFLASLGDPLLDLGVGQEWQGTVQQREGKAAR